MNKDQQNLNDAGIYLFMEDFTEFSCKSAIEFIISKNLGSDLDELKLIINSRGGDGHSCFALIDAMHGSKIPVSTMGIGMVASAGLFTFMSGKKGRRFLSPRASFLSHQFSGSRWGKEHELIASAKEDGNMSKRIMTHYKKCTGLSEKKIRDKLLCHSDTWLTAKEALALGIGDKIVLNY